jgi:actin-related protein
MSFVVDLGSSSIKYGSSHDKKPKIIKSIVGEVDNKLKIGEDVLKIKKLENLEYPIQRGEIKKIEYFEKILQFCLKESKINSEETNLFLTHGTNCELKIGLQGSKKNVETICQVLFEEFSVPKLYLEISSLCSLFADGLTTGLVLDIGEGKTEVLPVYNGFLNPETIIRQDFGGKELTMYFSSILNEYDIFTTNIKIYEMIKEMKENICTLEDDKDIEYKLPDGKVIKIQKEERKKIPEILFDTSIVFGNECQNIQNLIHDTVEKSDIYLSNY